MDGRAAALAGAVQSLRDHEDGRASPRCAAPTAAARRRASRSGRSRPPPCARRSRPWRCARASRPTSSRGASRTTSRPRSPGTGRTLLPATADDLVVSCTCDAPLPCVARGRRGRPPRRRARRGRVPRVPPARAPREEVLAGLQRARRRPGAVGHGAARRRRPGPAAPRASRPSRCPRQVLERPELFYRPGEPAAALRTVFAPPEHPEAVLTRLGPPPLHDSEASRLLLELHRAIGLGARERLAGLGVAARGRARLDAPPLIPAASRRRP